MVVAAQETLPLRSLQAGSTRSAPSSTSPASPTFPIAATHLQPPTLIGMTRNESTGAGRTDDSALPADYAYRNTQPSYRLNSAFFLFGLLNNSLYVVILTAALELLPKGVPTGLVSFANIFPALVAKAVWPYVLRGRVRYTQRVWSCAFLSFVGMLLVSFFSSLAIRLLGISLASFSSGLGELTFLQLSTRYAPKGSKQDTTNYAGDGVGWFASGTGAAGLVGAGAWWIVRPLGVQMGMAILSVLPGFMLVVYLVVLPSVAALIGNDRDARGQYEALPAADETALDEDDEEEQEHSAGPNDESQESTVRLTFAEKMTLLRPMLLTYILPLVTVYFAEYTINQGVAPTLIYPLPTSSSHPLLALMIKKLGDYYPLYQLVYQTFVFLSRSSISMFRLPAIPKEYLWLPAILQSTLLGLQISESVYSWFRTSIASPLVIVLICIEGLAGGAAYVSVFYSIGMNEEAHSAITLNEADDALTMSKQLGLAKRAQEHEFRIGCVGFGDSLGILIASLISMPLQVGLCEHQVHTGRSLCQQV